MVLEKGHKKGSNKDIASGVFTLEYKSPPPSALKWLSFHDNCTESKTFPSLLLQMFSPSALLPNTAMDLG